MQLMGWLDFDNSTIFKTSYFVYTMQRLSILPFIIKFKFWQWIPAFIMGCLNQFFWTPVIWIDPVEYAHFMPFAMTFAILFDICMLPSVIKYRLYFVLVLQLLFTGVDINFLVSYYKVDS
jgi:hypothetical protein